MSVSDPANKTPSYTLPTCAEAEQALLGSLLVQNDLLVQVADILEPEHFGDPGHVLLYGTIRELVTSGRRATPITLKELLDHINFGSTENPVSCAVYCTRLAANVVTLVNSVEYARVIRATATRRDAITKMQDAIDQLQRETLDMPAERTITSVQQMAMTLGGADDSHGEHHARAIDIFHRVLQQIEDRRHGRTPPSMATGIVDLDLAIGGGLRRGTLVVCGGIPGSGKSALGYQLATHAASHPVADGRPARAIVFSFEMTADELMYRTIAARTGIPLSHLMNGNVSDHDIAGRLVPMAEPIASWPLEVFDPAGKSPGWVALRVRQFALRHGGVDVVVLDHLGLMDYGGRPQERRLLIGQAANMLKALAKELKCVVIVLSQLNRDLFSREDKRPVLADLRESGEIEAAADVVLFVHREFLFLREPHQRENEDIDEFNKRHAAYSQRRHDLAGKAELVIAKNRQGTTDTIKCGWNPVGLGFYSQGREEEQNASGG